MIELLGLLFLTLFGLMLTLLIKLNVDKYSTIGVSFLIGFGLQTFIIFLLGLLGFSLTLFNGIIIPLVSILLIIIIKKEIVSKWIQLLSKVKFKKLFIQTKINLQENSYNTLLLSLLIFMTLLNLIYNIYWPVDGWDTLVLYDFRAKYFIESQSIFPTPELDYFTPYPLLTSLGHTFIYQLGDLNPRIIYSFIFVSFILIFYGQLRQSKSQFIALSGTLFMLTVPTIYEHARIPYTNLPYTIYYVAGLIFLYNWYKKNNNASLAISGLLIALSCWTRYIEPFWIIPVAVVFLLSLAKRKILPPILYLLAILSVKQSWIYYLKIVDTNFNNTIGGQINSSIQSLSQSNLSLLFIAEVLYQFYLAIINPYLYVILIFIFVVIAEIIWKKTSVFLLFLVTLNFLMFLLGFYIFALSYSDWKQVIDSGTRLSMFIVPLLSFYIFHSKFFEFNQLKIPHLNLSRNRKKQSKK